MDKVLEDVSKVPDQISIQDLEMDQYNIDDLITELQLLKTKISTLRYDMISFLRLLATVNEDNNNSKTPLEFFQEINNCLMILKENLDNYIERYNKILPIVEYSKEQIGVNDKIMIPIMKQEVKIERPIFNKDANNYNNNNNNNNNNNSSNNPSAGYLNTNNISNRNTSGGSNIGGVGHIVPTPNSSNTTNNTNIPSTAGTSGTTSSIGTSSNINSNTNTNTGKTAATKKIPARKPRAKQAPGARKNLKLNDAANGENNNNKNNNNEGYQNLGNNPSQPILL
ncbi:hypothetical protein PACTADRAFT_51247 [Pachysolen tannophilus NRRL Y-2460]|uniref:Uncharacterized protein n=1 Tax=Pachysolen tannophilus NRRL Y-2460 TaxID=669874 RepID=A0A1E4TRN8_PACTA|nr:hypothetical protein PACTADRAFT_51247 [Pachysolen tannophilus NRRL Y-2460]